MSDFFREWLEEERAKNDAHQKTRGDFAYLIGYYGNQAEHSGNAELAELVNKMTEVLNGTWQRPGGTR